MPNGHVLGSVKTASTGRALASRSSVSIADLDRVPTGPNGSSGARLSVRPSVGAVVRRASVSALMASQISTVAAFDSKLMIVLTARVRHGRHGAEQQRLVR